ncbi:hypothetical protein SEVIR_1G114150v4 [Setaria viridis]
MSFPPRRKRWKAGAACAGGKEARSAALRSRTVAAAGRRTVVVRPSSARTGSTTARWSFPAIADDGEGDRSARIASEIAAPCRRRLILVSSEYFLMMLLKPGWSE